VPLLEVEELEARLAQGDVDTIVAALPHGTWKRLLEENAWLAGAARVIDLSSDHRDGSAGYVYGLPEAFREEIASAERVANPGCYPTAAALALLPAAQRGWIDGPVTVSAVSGVSGAGRGAKAQDLVRRGRRQRVVLRGGHDARARRRDGAHAGPRRRAGRGRVRARARADGARHPAFGAGEARAARVDRGGARGLRRALRRRAFVRLLEPGAWPSTAAVKGSNRVDVQVTTLFGGTTLLATAAIDNLAKGAASQALQNLNLMTGCPETTGLSRHGRPW
jgi:N-acetyl-gamma-glutamyl-phosphate reductase